LNDSRDDGFMVGLTSKTYIWSFI